MTIIKQMKEVQIMSNQPYKEDFKIPELKIVENDKTIFDEQFNVPIYQRDFAWGKDEIEQLLKDLSTFNENNKYYLGSLIIKKETNTLDVIDGQQRLTALYILLSYLNTYLNKNLLLKPLTYSCRPESTKFLNNLMTNNFEDLSSNDRTKRLYTCYEIIKTFFDNKAKTDNDFTNKFFNKLEKVILFKIEVPENTELNRYFITMNTTGEQLEQHEILKARLIGYISNNKSDNEAEQHLFALIWEACQDMNS